MTRIFRGRNLLNLRKNSWGNEQFESKVYSLIIRGDLDFKKLNEELKFNAPEIAKKGEMLSRVVGECQEDVYIYSKKYEDDKSADEYLYNFLTEIYAVKDIIRDLAEKHNISLRLYIQSSQAQISFSMKNKLLPMLAEMNLPIDFSIFSWGGV